MSRLQTTVILAMTADGKIADFQGNPARFSSEIDKQHLERQISLVDAVLLGGNTLRAYGTTLLIANPQLLQARKQQQKPPQPVHIVCSASGKINPKLRFFSQPICRWLLTTKTGAKLWQSNYQGSFDRLLIAEKETPNTKLIDWLAAFQFLLDLEITKLAILGGGNLIASLLELDLIDEFWLTVCPVIFGGTTAPTPVEGKGFLAEKAKQLQLLKAEVVEEEIFLHYRRRSSN